MGGYGLSDDYDSPFKWVFPDTTLDAGAFLLIWATNKDRVTPGGELHTNFAIASAGEEVILTAPDGTRIDELEPTEIPTDISIGRQPDGTGEWVFFDESTPGAPNSSSEPILGLLEPPVFSHSPGFYTADFKLTISHPYDDVKLYYTLDGTEPTTSSAIYNSPIVINDRSSEPNRLSNIPTNFIDGSRGFRAPSSLIPKGTVIRVKAFKNNYTSSTATGSFFVFPRGSGKHSLPLVSIITDEKNFFDDEIGIYVPGVNYRRGNDATGNYMQSGYRWERLSHLEFFDKDGLQQISQNVGLRIHGGFTRRFPQKSLRVYARSEYGEGRINYPIFSSQSDDSYNRLILRNSGNDFGQTMFRDALAQTVVKHFDFDTQAYEPAVVYINGEFWGIHNIRERYDRHYLERAYGIDSDNIDLLTMNSIAKEGSHWHYQNLINFAQQNDLNVEENYREVSRRMDLNNYMDYFIAQIYLINTDWPHNNIDYWRLRVPYDEDAEKGHDGRWRWLMYDVDRSFGFPLNTPFDFDMLDWVTAERNYRNESWPNLLFRSLMNSDRFRIQFINRMADHLNSSFLPDRVIGYIDRMSNDIEPEMEEHINRWSTPNNMNWWYGFVDMMRQFSRERPGHMKQNIIDHFGIESVSKIIVNIEEADIGDGAVFVNSLHISPETEGVIIESNMWSGTYFSGIPIQLKAIPNPGFIFSHWVIDQSDQYIDDEEIEIMPETIKSITPVFKVASIDLVDPYSISDSYYLFSEWDSDNRAGSYPESMVFVMMNEDDPGLASDISRLVTGAYNHESRTRIEGFGDQGFAFINTSNPDGNPGYLGTRLGGAVLVLNTQNVNNAEVGWRAGTLEPNSRVYHIRLQYRTDLDAEFQDLLDPDGNVIEYKRNELAGHSQFIGPYPLPEDAVGRGRVELMWRYYYTGIQIDTDSNQRSKLNISTIYVANRDLYPEIVPYKLTNERYHFENWTSQNPAGSYPLSMAFVFMDDTDPTLNSGIMGYAEGSYDLDSRTRINGLGENGFSFTNTSDIEGNPGYPGRRLGGAILSLNTDGQGSTMVEWTGGTVNPGSMIYHLRLQYRVGTEGEFQDVYDRFGNVVEYRRSEQAGHLGQFGPIQLPPETDNQPEVQLLWKYYYTGVQADEESEDRSELNISYISAWSQQLLGSEPGEVQEFRLYQNYPNPFFPQSTIRYDLPKAQHVKLEIYSISGQFIKTVIDREVPVGRHSEIVDVSGLASGIYIYRLTTNEFTETLRMTVIK